MAYRPDIVIDNEILNLVSDIAVLLERIPDEIATQRHLRLRHNNRVRTIHATAAIEGNRLSLEEVTDIINGKRVLGNPRDILEIRNAQAAYGNMNDYDPFSIKDLLAAHGTMMAGLTDMPGGFRDCGVGVYKGPVAVHIAPEPEDVPLLMTDLMDWSRNSDAHPLIKGCLFHSRFEYIHPFTDGNGRMGRLWHALILSKWMPAFGHLPTEDWINANRKNYYDALREADRGDNSAFIKFMLTGIRAVADEFADETRSIKKNEPNIRQSILDIISDDPYVTAARMADAAGVSSRTVKRHLSFMTGTGMIKRVGSDKTGHWEIVRTPTDDLSTEK